MPSYGWTNIEEIGYQLYEAYPDDDPFSIAFPELRNRVQALPGFEAEAGHNSNEKILEAIQMAWQEEKDEDA